MRASAMKLAQLGAAVLMLALALGVRAPGQEHYPSRPITIVVPITAGTTIDILARLFGESLGLASKSSLQIVRAPAASLELRPSRARRPTATLFCWPIPGTPSWAP